MIYRAPIAAQSIRGRIIKKDPQIQCLAIELLENGIRNCHDSFHREIAADNFMGVILRLIKRSDISPNVVFFIMITRFKLECLHLSKHVPYISERKLINTQYFKMYIMNLRTWDILFLIFKSELIRNHSTQNLTTTSNNKSNNSKADYYISILTKEGPNAKFRNDLKLLIENIKLTNVFY